MNAKQTSPEPTDAFLELGQIRLGVTRLLRELADTALAGPLDRLWWKITAKMDAIVEAELQAASDSTPCCDADEPEPCRGCSPIPSLDGESRGLPGRDLGPADPNDDEESDPVTWPAWTDLDRWSPVASDRYEETELAELGSTLGHSDWN